jgi:hypothetical protein
MDPAQNEFLAQLEKKSGKPNHFFRTMANRPEVLKNFVPLTARLRGRARWSGVSKSWFIWRYRSPTNAPTARPRTRLQPGKPGSLKMS